MDYTILVPYVVGTLFGLWIGFKAGVLKGTTATIDMLMISKFLLYKKLEDGEIMFIKPKESEQVVENQ
jgi:hypothetical protein|tara:strand:- start:79 stop:282 length:204 start_codon:yes stop_codon:yes gene_type:complete